MLAPVLFNYFNGANGSPVCEVQLGVFQVTTNPSLFNLKNQKR